MENLSVMSHTYRNKTTIILNSHLQGSASGEISSCMVMNLITEANYWSGQSRTSWTNGCTLALSMVCLGLEIIMRKPLIVWRSGLTGHVSFIRPMFDQCLKCLPSQMEKNCVVWITVTQHLRALKMIDNEPPGRLITSMLELKLETTMLF